MSASRLVGSALERGRIDACRCSFNYKESFACLMARALIKTASSRTKSPELSEEATQLSLQKAEMGSLVVSFVRLTAASRVMFDLGVI